VEEDDDDNGNFVLRSERFADDLGLVNGPLRNVVEDDDAESDGEREMKIEAAMNRIVGGGEASDNFVLPQNVLNAIALPPKARSGDVSARVGIPVPLAAASFIDRGDITQRIVFIVEHFSPLVAGIVGSDSTAFIQSLTNRPDRELEGLLKTLERSRSVGNIASGFKQLFFVAGQATEGLTKVIGMRTHGFADQLRQHDAEVSMIMKEIAMNQWESVKALDSPEMRLLSLFSLTLVQTDAQNRFLEHAKAAGAARVSPSVMAATSDL
jgi:hypothetical protein